MYHHDSRDYQTAVSEAATFARGKFEGMIAQGAQKMRTLVDQMDALVPDDMIASTKSLRFQPRQDDAVRTLDMVLAGNTYTLHPHALGQVAQRSEIKSLTPVLRALSAADSPAWQKDLAAHTLNEAYGHISSKFLVRSLAGDVRGFLSDRYRRYDVRPIAGAFLDAANGYGCSCLDGIATETKVSFRMVLPMLFEPVAEEVMLYGLELRNSDFGDGALVVRSFVDRVWCTNLATMSSELNQVHLGGRLPENIELSLQTYALDTQTMASAVADVVKGILAAETVSGLMGRIKAAHEEVKDPKAFDTILKTLAKAEKEKVLAKWDEKEEDGITVLPKGKTSWRMSNAISWLATQTESQDRRMDLEELAGKVLK